MYGPPQDCKGKFGREDKSAQMYSPLLTNTFTQTFFIHQLFPCIHAADHTFH
jgi:hypothetical protein